MKVPTARSPHVQLASGMLQSGFFIRNGTRKRKAPNTMEYVDPKMPTRGWAVMMAKNWTVGTTGIGVTS